MPPPEKLRRKLLTPNADGDGRTDRGNTICPFHHSLNSGGIKQNTLYYVLVHRLLYFMAVTQYLTRQSVKLIQYLTRIEYAIDMHSNDRTYSTGKGARIVMYVKIDAQLLHPVFLR